MIMSFRIDMTNDWNGEGQESKLPEDVRPVRISSFDLNCLSNHSDRNKSEGAWRLPKLVAACCLSSRLMMLWTCWIDEHKLLELSDPCARAARLPPCSLWEGQGWGDFPTKLEELLLILARGPELTARLKLKPFLPSSDDDWRCGEDEDVSQISILLWPWGGPALVVRANPQSWSWESETIGRENALGVAPVKCTHTQHKTHQNQTRATSNCVQLHTSIRSQYQVGQMGRAASGGALAPEPPHATRSQPEPMWIVSKTLFPICKHNIRMWKYNFAPGCWKSFNGVSLSLHLRACWGATWAWRRVSSLFLSLSLSLALSC